MPLQELIERLQALFRATPETVMNGDTSLRMTVNSRRRHGLTSDRA
jgi:hypothetical protein